MRWNCLSKEHVLKDWKSLHCCKIGGCNQQYHNLLHGEKTPEASINELETSEVNQTTYLHLLPIIVSQWKNSVSAVVFLDSRSDSTLSHSHPEPLKMTNKWVVDNLLKLKQKIDIEDLKVVINICVTLISFQLIGVDFSSLHLYIDIKIGKDHNPLPFSQP